MTIPHQQQGADPNLRVTSTPAPADQMTSEDMSLDTQGPSAPVTATATASASGGDAEVDAAPSQKTLHLWHEVAHGIDNNSTGELWSKLTRIRLQM